MTAPYGFDEQVPQWEMLLDVLHFGEPQVATGIAFLLLAHHGAGMLTGAPVSSIKAQAATG